MLESVVELSVVPELPVLLELSVVPELTVLSVVPFPEPLSVVDDELVLALGVEFSVSSPPHDARHAHIDATTKSASIHFKRC